jgi:hypothetical protein
VNKSAGTDTLHADKAIAADHGLGKKFSDKALSTLKQPVWAT